jgi:oxepin-CoA hydrolase/3-oxo-5,6-dehydrosuberyl-CoA semialdehyde dehydrogenase
METLESYLNGAWTQGKGKGATLVNPTTEATLAEASTDGLDFASAIGFAREQGGPALRALTFAERGELLRAMSRALHGARDALIEVAIANGGNTRSDAKFDIDGAIGTLAYYADLGKELGAQRLLVDGEGTQLGRSPRAFGAHVLTPRTGVAVHVNAFNFPAWGLGEKAACALLAGMPIVTKPATSTALLAHRVVKLWVDADLLPKGALSLVTGSPGSLLSHLGGDDCLAFTGSADTAATLRALGNVVRNSVRVNVEADSLNAAVLGPDVTVGSETYNLFLRDVARDIVQKAGQKCTAIRRLFAPANVVAQVEADLVDRLRDAVVGDPAVEGVTVGPLATASQLRSVHAGIAELQTEAKLVLGARSFERRGAPGDKGYFVAPTLLRSHDARASRKVHELEVFGPAATLLAYDGSASEAIELVRRGAGGLVCSVYSDDRAFAGEVLFGIASLHGRVVLASEKVADQLPGPGAVLPQSIHGGPGRAGGGEELGGLRGLAFYSQRTAVQGSRPMLEALLGLKK